MSTPKQPTRSNLVTRKLQTSSAKTRLGSKPVIRWYTVRGGCSKGMFCLPASLSGALVACLATRLLALAVRFPPRLGRRGGAGPSWQQGVRKGHLARAIRGEAAWTGHCRVVRSAAAPSGSGCRPPASSTRLHGAAATVSRRPRPGGKRAPLGNATKRAATELQELNKCLVGLS